MTEQAIEEATKKLLDGGNKPPMTPDQAMGIMKDMPERIQLKVGSRGGGRMLALKARQFNCSTS